MDVLKKIKEIKLVPVTVFNSLDEIIPTLNNLISGNVPITEICFRTDYAKEAIEIATKEFKDRILIGAGTIINAKQCVDAINAGAQFIVSPGISTEVFNVCKKYDVPYLPGVVTPSEIMKALELGITYVKFFPAGVFGGLKAIKALSAAFPQIYFMPTGGVDLSNLKEFIEFKNIFAIGGSFLLKGDIVENCKQANKIIKEGK